MKVDTLTNLAYLLGCSGHFEPKPITSFETDSRKIREGGVFVALKGKKVDGHSFLQEVASRGGIGAIVSSDYHGEHFGLALFSVKDVLLSLQDAARILYGERKGITVGVTGSIGKTTTKEFVATLLERKFKVLKTLESANSQVGVPMSIFNWNSQEADVCVIEMAMSESGQLKNLVTIAPPDIAVLTRIGLSHAAFFKEGIEGIAAAKAEIFSHEKTKVAIINEHTIPFKAISQIKQSKIFYGMGGNLDYYVKKVTGGVIIVERGESSPLLQVHFEATHLLENFCAAVAVARRLGFEWEEIKERVKELKPFKRRFEKVEKKGVIYFNDSFNASPESTCAALTNLPSPKIGKKKIAVLGEMKELGAFAESSHHQVAECALLHIDHLLCYGKGTLKMVDIFERHKRPVEYFELFEQMRARLSQLAAEGDIVLVKGANSDALWRLVEESI